MKSDKLPKRVLALPQLPWPEEPVYTYPLFLISLHQAEGYRTTHNTQAEFGRTFIHIKQATIRQK